MTTAGGRGPKASASIGVRVGLCLAVIVVAVLAVTSVNLMVTRAVGDGAVGSVDQARDEAIPLLQLAESANAVARTARQLDPDRLDLDALEEAVADTNARVDALAGQLFSAPSVRAEFDAGARRWARALDVVEEAEAEADALELDELLAVGSRLFPLIEGAVIDWNDGHQLAMAHLADRLAAAEAQRTDVTRLSIAVTLFGIAVSLAIGLRLIHTVVRPTQDLRAATSRIAAGEHVPVQVQGPAELAQLAHDFNTMADRLRAREATLVHRALHDPLTGFGNRTMLTDRLGQAIRRRQRHPADDVAVLVLDLDGFKNLNDSLGHALGDEALRSVAERLAGCLRAEDTFTRLGGDEFAVVLEGDDAQAEVTARRLRDCLRDPITVAGRSIRLTASVGIATTHAGASAPDDLLRDADLAMYAAKRRGGDTVERFTRRMHEEVQDRLQLEEDLRAGLGAGQIEVHYQPIVALESGRVAAVEALARWRHPTEGLLAPDRFIVLAEVTGLIVPLGWEVVRLALDAAATWPAVDGVAPAVAVNLSPRQLVEPDVVSRLLGLLDECGVAPDRLIVEITETTTLDQVVDAADELGRLRSVGVRVALDDFGTGYTSLRYLHGTPVDLLKIDRAFVHGVADSRDQRSLVRTIVELADDMGYGVVAEGVERPEDLAVLTELSCRYVQGYALSRPVDEAGLPAVLTELGRRAEAVQPVAPVTAVPVAP
jgi:diguanylate cyclase (GGDEF)-like protein